MQLQQEANLRIRHVCCVVIVAAHGADSLVGLVVRRETFAQASGSKWHKRVLDEGLSGL